MAMHDANFIKSGSEQVAIFRPAARSFASSVDLLLPGLGGVHQVISVRERA